MCKLVRFMIANIAVGSTIGWTVAAALIAMNSGGLRDAILASSSPPVLLAAMALPVGGIFGIGYLATALMFLSADD